MEVREAITNPRHTNRVCYVYYQLCLGFVCIELVMASCEMKRILKLEILVSNNLTIIKLSNEKSFKLVRACIELSPDVEPLRQRVIHVFTFSSNSFTNLFFSPVVVLQNIHLSIMLKEGVKLMNQARNYSVKFSKSMHITFIRNLTPPAQLNILDSFLHDF